MNEADAELDPVERAVLFALTAHAGQRRKDAASPYIVHPVEVLKRCADLGVHDAEVLAAAALHDVVEDTPATPAQVRRDFGARVAALVDELSYEPERDGSKPAYMAAFAGRSVESLVIKLCDRAANVDDYRRTRPDYAPRYAAKAATLYAAVDARLGEIERAFGAPVAAAAAAESLRLASFAAPG